jgi:hypothetical protein
MFQCVPPAPFAPLCTRNPAIFAGSSKLYKRSLTPGFCVKTQARLGKKYTNRAANLIVWLVDNLEKALD